MVEKLQSNPISIFYPNGGTIASQMYVWDGSEPILWNGQVTFSGTISIGTVSGTLTNNNAAPAANNFGVLPAIVSTTNLGYTAGNQALLRVDTTGALVVSATISTAGLATSANQTNGSQLVQVVNTTGSTQAFGAGTTTSSVIRVVLPTDQSSIPVTGNVTATVSNATVTGTLTNNNAAPAANNLGVLPAICSTTGLGYTDGRQVLLRTDTTGALVVSATLSTTGLATSANQTNGSQLTQVVNTTGSTQAFGAGTTTATTIRVVLPTDQTSIPVSFTTGTTTISGNVTVVQPTGTNLHAVLDSTSVVSTVTAVTAITNALPAGTNAIGKLVASNGFSTTALSTTSKAVTTAATVMTGYYIYNPNASAAYVQCFDLTTGAITLGTTVPKQSFGIPATSAANIAGKRITFTTALSIAATTTMYGSTAPSSGLDVNFDYE